jgi:molybdate transport system ATP-binding protein
MATTLENVKRISDLRERVSALDIAIRLEHAPSFQLDVEFRAKPGITILFGPSGAGKTTLLDCIAGLKTPDRGHIRAGDRVLFDSRKSIDVPARRRKIGYVFQDLALFPHLDVGANVAYGLAGADRRERKRRVDQVLDQLGILQFRKRLPGQLSGGERQRVALARALVTDPSLLLLDEPLAALDLAVRMKIADDLRRLVQNLPIPVIYVTHNRDEVFTLGEALLVLECGKIIAQGAPHEVLSAPRGETIAQLAGFENIFDVVVASIHEERGTMTCRIDPIPIGLGPVELETPLVGIEAVGKLRVGISAGDILLSTSAPLGLSARNILAGRLVSLERRDMMVIAVVDCGVELFVRLTLGARDSLGLRPGQPVWTIIKTHSCHLLDRDT